MVVSQKNNNNGRRAEFGGLCFDEGYMQVFVGYHKSDKGLHKVLLDFDEVRALAGKYGTREKASRRKAVIHWLNNKWG